MIRKLFTLSALLAFALTAAHAQTENTHLKKQLDRVDLGVVAIGQFTSSVSGTITDPNAPNTGFLLTDSPSSTVGVLGSLRYIARPYVGFEVNYSHARYTENFNYTGGIQTGATEYSAGYVITPDHKFFGYQPFASVGTGTMAFKPTPYGGQGLTEQARQLYYYTAGVQNEFFSQHFGLRGGFRQAFMLAPDYGQNYLTIKKRYTTSEPFLGFYIKF